MSGSGYRMEEKRGTGSCPSHFKQVVLEKIVLM